MKDLPNELIQDILNRGDLQEIRGLCTSNKFFKEHCNVISKRTLENRYGDYYKMYIILNTYYICINTNEGQSSYAKCIGLDKVPETFKNVILSKFEQRMQRDTDISWTLDTNENTRMLSINFHYYSDVDCVMNFDVVISGDLKDYRTCEELVDRIEGVFESLE